MPERGMGDTTLGHTARFAITAIDPDGELVVVGPSGVDKAHQVAHTMRRKGFEGVQVRPYYSIAGCKGQLDGLPVTATATTRPAESLPGVVDVHLPEQEAEQTAEEVDFRDELPVHTGHPPRWPFDDLVRARRASS